MDTALIIVIVAVALLLVAFVARRVWARGQEARREKAGELRVEATRAQERARQAEVEAEREREAAEARGRRADRIDPDAESPGGRFRPFSRDRGDEDYDEDERDYDEEQAGERRRSLWDRLVHR
jgi:flagellar biosynthesis/type III secretory pathway M-ring protein FliF/YscJ